MDKTIAIKNKILSLVETHPEGRRLPSARALASEFDVSFQFVQRVVDDLSERGVIQVFPRSGMEPHPYWRRRLVSGVWRMHGDKLLAVELGKLINRQMPEIFVASEFEYAPMELSVTHYLLSHHRSYCDLNWMLDNAVPDRGVLFSKLLSSGKFGKELCGIPLFFSPKVMVLNRKLFDLHNCPLPSENWTWDEFEKTVSTLSEKMEPFRVFGAWNGITEWMNFVTVNGGCIFDDKNSDEVKIDSPEALEALEFFRTLFCRAAVPDKFIGKYNHNEDFLAGNVAIYPGARQSVSSLFTRGRFKHDEIVLRPMPVREKGMAPRSMLAANYFCVRKECVDMQLAQNLMELLLSERCQRDIIGAMRFGIPIVQSAAQASFDSNDPHDAVFARTLFHVVPRYNITNPVSYQLINKCMGEALSGTSENMKEMVKKLADTLRMLVRFGVNDN